MTGEENETRGVCVEVFSLCCKINDKEEEAMLEGSFVNYVCRIFKWAMN